MSFSNKKFHNEIKHLDNITDEIASGHPTGGSQIPSFEKNTEGKVRSALLNLWGIHENIQSLGSGSTAQVWRASTFIVKLASDEAVHFNAGLRASLAIEASVIKAGTPILNRFGEPSTVITVGKDDWMMAVLRHVEGAPTSMHEFEPVVLGELLAKIHVSLRDIDPTGAWTVQDVLGHMERGIHVDQPLSTRQMISSSIDAVKAWYQSSYPNQQLIRGDGPELLKKEDEISGMVDWGGVRLGSVVDDIGCWTLHGSTKNIKEYTTEFVKGYTKVSTLTPQEEQAIPLFQQLRLVSRACYVTDPAALNTIERWMSNIR